MASETKAFFNIDNFKTELRKSGIARTNRFEVIIAPPKKLRSFPGDARLVNLYCDVCSDVSYDVCFDLCFDGCCDLM